VSRQLFSLVQAAALGMAAVGFSGQALAEVRADVVDRIKPVGQVTVQGQAQPAAPAPAAPAPAAAAPAAPAPAAAANPPAAPEAAAPATADAGGEHPGQARYQKTCFACHATGAANAPKLGDKAAWEPRIAKGIEALYTSAMNGVAGTAMAPRGTCPDCTDDELKQVVDYMVSQGK